MVERLIVYDPQAGRGKANKYIEQFKTTESLVLEISDFLNKPYASKELVVVGGDGTLRRTLIPFVAQSESPRVILVPAGTGNVLWHELKNKGATSSPLDQKEEAGQYKKLRPMSIQGEKLSTLSIIVSGIGAFETAYLRDGRRPLRKLPDPLWVAFMGSKTFLSLFRDHGISTKDAADIFTLCGRAGPLQLINSSDLSLDSDKIGRITIKGEISQQVSKWLLLIIYLANKWNPPAEIAQVLIQPSHISPPITEINIDGDVGFLYKPTEVTFSRIDQTIPITARVAKRK